MQSNKSVKLSGLLVVTASLSACGGNSFGDALANFFPEGITPATYANAITDGISQGQFNAQYGYVAGTPEAEAAWQAYNTPMYYSSSSSYDDGYEAGDYGDDVGSGDTYSDGTGDTSYTAPAPAQDGPKLDCWGRRTGNPADNRPNAKVCPM